MSKEDKAKVDIIQVSADPGDENLFLAKDGTYKAISGGAGSGDGLTQDQKDKLDKIIINNPDGKLFLANDGVYKDVTVLFAISPPKGHHLCKTDLLYSLLWSSSIHQL